MTNSYNNLFMIYNPLSVNISTRFSSNSEKFASELPENLGRNVSSVCIGISMSKSSTKHWGVTHH